MKYFRNLKIRLKLFLGFGIALALMLVLIVYAVSQQNYVGSRFRTITDSTMMQSIELLNAQIYAESIRRATAAATAHAAGGNTAAINTASTELTTYFNAVMLRLDAFNEVTRINDMYLPYQITRAINASDELRDTITDYYNNISRPLIEYALAGDVESALALAGAGLPIIQQVTAQLENMRTGVRDSRIEHIAYAYNTINSTTIYLIIVSVAIFLVTLILAFVVSHIISKPINALVKLTKDVSEGNMNVNVNRTNISKDEIGVLTNYIVNLIEVVRNLVDDLNELSVKHVGGFYKVRIDDSRYSGEYKELTKITNALVDYYVNDFIELVEVIKQYGEGNFDIQVSEYSGDWGWANKAVNDLRNKFMHLTQEISGLAEKVAKGDLSSHIDASNFSGSWREIMTGLNHIAKSVYEPLKVLELALLEMQRGNFDLNSIDSKIAAAGVKPSPTDYSGVYRTTMQIFDDTCNATASYINELDKILAQMAQGNLLNKIEREYVGSYDLIKRSINTILDNLNSTLSDVKVTVEQVTRGAEQISTSAMFLADGTTKQTASIEELSSSIALIHEKAIQASSDATAANESSGRIQDYIAKGGKAVKSMEATMNKVKNSGEDIRKVIDVISNVSFQTNLLALNASVEAARAGEHGKGFSVVADEVRSLAGRSRQSTSDTSQIIEEDLKHVSEGLKATSDVVTSFGTIADNILEISGHITEIAEISGKQLESISNINASVSEIAGVVTDISATAEESASASQELSSQAELLREKVEFFRLRT